MNTVKKIVPTPTQVIGSVLVTAIVGYAAVCAFRMHHLFAEIFMIFALFSILYPVLWMPRRIIITPEEIRLKLVVGEKVFLKSDYDIQPISAFSCKYVFTIRLFATSVFLYWGYFWNKPLGRFFALCVSSSDLVMLTRKSDGAKFVIDSPWETQPMQ